MILAHTDYTYLDCGSSGWVSPGGYWCGPYHEWYKLYGYLQDVATSWGTTAGQLREAGVVGSEALMWGEEADEQNFDSKVGLGNRNFTRQIHDFTNHYLNQAIDK